ncbi:superoxide dismutase [Candidatus Odyssella thessalonicensis]|uniref:superoxide dismutase n=1 Tax=Candidatus Odyssella thessalonicensis TaxID=84647 RepID=UPI000225C07B|nr:superoxide dismutase [Candidatus Odyssella thessalonicensis]
MPHTLPPLPYDMSALEPHITANTLSYHHGKHHQAYVTNLNNLLQGHALENASLEDVIMAAAGKPDMAGIFNNAAQVWNHTFYWNCMKPNGGGQPSAAFKAKIETAFGSWEKFLADFKQAAVTQFGSGWAWLVKDASGALKLLKTGNADLPMAHQMTALLTCDVWEHAYYLDYQNRRPDYVETFLNHLVNWDFVESQM